MKHIIRIIGVVACVLVCSHMLHMPESIERHTRPGCPKSSPFCEFDNYGVPYYYFYKDNVVEVWSVYEEIAHNPRTIANYVKHARKCFMLFYKEMMGAPPEITDDAQPIYVMIVNYDYLNKGSPIQKKYKGSGRLAALSRCSYHNDVWPEINERSVIFIASEATTLKNVSHETLHQMICRTKNWTDMLNARGITTPLAIGNFEESLAEQFENYDCLFE